MGFVCACFVVPFLLIFRNQFSISRPLIWSDFKDKIRIGGWLFLNSILWSIGNYAYPWLLAMMHGPQATGIWAACMSIMAIVNIALAGILNILTPRIARAHADNGTVDFRRYIHKAYRNYVIFTVVLACIPLLIGETLITIVYGPAYGHTHLIIGMLALNAVFAAVTGCFGRGLMVIGYANWDFVFNFSTLILVFTFGWWSTEVYGPLGAAIGLTAANGLATLMRFIAFERISWRMMLVSRSK